LTSPPLRVSPPPPGFARIRFVTQETSLFGRLIRWRTMGQVSHAECVLPNGTIIAALSEGVRNVPGDYDTTSTSQIFVDVLMSPDDVKRWVAYLWSRVGRPYDWDAIYGEALHLDWRRPGGFICSMLCALSLREAGTFMRPLSEPAHEITPRDLLLMLSAHPAARVHPLEKRK
jgi:hypothetical protein